MKIIADNSTNDAPDWLFYCPGCKGHDGELEITWGWGGEERLVRVKDIAHKLRKFNWMYFKLPSIGGGL